MWYAIAIASAALFGLLAHRFTKGSRAATVGGVAIGIAVVVYNPLRQEREEQRLSPLMHIEVPKNFRHDTVILIVDPAANAELAWSAKTGEARIAAPPSGVVRLKSLGKFANHESRALLSDGREDWGRFNSYLNGAPFLVYDFKQHGASQPEVGLMSDAEIAHYFRQRESEAPPETQVDF